jgi:diguanylate cyclase (GGDEF)-like protein
MQILIADQDSQHRQKILARVEAWGHTVIEALAGRIAVEACRKKCPDLIFIDNALSGESGIELVRQIRQVGGHAVWVPIILMGEHITDEEIIRGVEAGIDNVIQKPLSEAQLMLCVHSAQRHLNLKEEVFKVAHELVVVNRALQNVVTQDVLTGINNSNSFEDALEQEWFAAKKLKAPISLILLNLDFFQAYNQTYGAQAGDEVIKRVATSLKMALPSGNAMLARMTGETFAVLLTNTDGRAATLIAENLHQAIESLSIEHKNSGCSDHITASFGVATVEESAFTKPWDLKDTADFALYQAKHRGRNRVVFMPVVDETAKSANTNNT